MIKLKFSRVCFSNKCLTYINSCDFCLVYSVVFIIILIIIFCGVLFMSYQSGNQS